MQAPRQVDMLIPEYFHQAGKIKDLAQEHIKKSKEDSAKKGKGKS